MNRSVLLDRKFFELDILLCLWGKNVLDACIFGISGVNTL